MKLKVFEYTILKSNKLFKNLFENYYLKFKLLEYHLLCVNLVNFEILVYQNFLFVYNKIIFKSWIYSNNTFSCVCIIKQFKKIE